MMSRFTIILFVFLLSFIMAVTIVGVIHYHLIIRCFGPVTMGLFMLSILFLVIGFKKEYRHFHRGAFSSLLFGVLFVAGYMIMCLLTGEDISLFDFFLYRF